MAATEVMESLATMSPDDLKQVVGRATHLLGGSTQAPTSDRALARMDDDMRLLWAEMASVLKRVGDVPPLSVILRGRKGQILREASAAVFTLLVDGFNVTHPAERVKAVRLIVGLTAQDLNRRGALTPFRLAQRLRTAERTVDRHFPGYRASKLLGLIVKQVRGD